MRLWNPDCFFLGRVYAKSSPNANNVSSALSIIIYNCTSEIKVLFFFWNTKEIFIPLTSSATSLTSSFFSSLLGLDLSFLENDMLLNDHFFFFFSLVFLVSGVSSTLLSLALSAVLSVTADSFNWSFEEVSVSGVFGVLAGSSSGRPFSFTSSAGWSFSAAAFSSFS